MINLFEPTIPESEAPIEDKDYHAELVGPGKKFADEKALAKSVYEKDLYIPKLHSELAESRQEIAKLQGELSAHARLEEIADKIARTRQAEAPVSKEPSQAALEKSVEISPDQIAAEVKSQLSILEKSKTVEMNVEKSRQFLVQKYGDSFPQKLTKLASSLKMTPEYLNALAANSPDAFRSVIEAVDPSQAEPFKAPPVSGVRFAPQMTEPKNYQEISDKFRKEYPKDYHTPKVQQMIWDAVKPYAEKHGEAFFR